MTFEVFVLRVANEDVEALFEVVPIGAKAVIASVNGAPGVVTARSCGRARRRRPGIVPGVALAEDLYDVEAAPEMRPPRGGARRRPWWR